MVIDNQADPYGRGSYCIVAALHGAESSEARILRRFRDTLIQTLPFGETLITLYYRMSPAAASSLKHTGGRQFARYLITGFSRIVKPLTLDLSRS